MTKKEIEARNAALSAKMQTEPERYIRVHNAIEILINIAGVLDNAIQEIDELAPFIFYGKMHAFKDMHRALDGCVEYARKQLNDDERYMAAAKDNYRLYDIISAMLAMGDTEQGWQQLNAVSKAYIETPAAKKRHIKRLINHGIALLKVSNPQLVANWENYQHK